MPVIESKYKPPLFFKNKHLQTIFPTNFRKIKSIKYNRERINTPDNDFLDLDWSSVNGERLAIILHGFEGNSYRDHILGMVKAFNIRNWDAVAMNQRGCSGEPNRLIKSYHAGFTEDLSFTINQIIEKKDYKEITLVGFSLGANIVLKYLGENGINIPGILKKAACVSALCDLKSSAIKTSQNPIYYNYFISKLYKKIKAKMEIMPDSISIDDFRKIKNLMDYDSFYIVKQNNFKDVQDFYEKCSSKQFLSNIKIPTFILTAKDDPILADNSFPVNEANNSEYLYFELSEFGGHTGFISFNKEKEYYSEKRITDFILGN